MEEFDEPEMEEDPERENRIAKVQVIGMAPDEECRHEMFVEVEWKQRILGVPLAQLMPINVDNQTREAVEDWHYWVAMGYEF